MISVAIIDDHKIFRTCLKEYLSNKQDFSVVIEEEDPEQFITQVKTSRPDIAIVDLFMPKMNGDTLTKHLKQVSPHTKIIILSMCTSLQKISELIDLGIHSYLAKNDNIENLTRAIYAVREHKIYKNKLFTEALYWSTMQNAKMDPNGKSISFTDREKKVMQLLWQEKTNKEIANELFLGIRSIEKIRQDIKERLGVKTTIGLLKFALENHIIEADSAILFSRMPQAVDFCV